MTLQRKRSSAVPSVGSGYLGGRPTVAPGAGRHAREAPRSFTWAWTAVVGALASGLVFLVAHRALVDDTYLALAHARTLAVDGVWGAQPQLPDNAATSPLHVVLLAGLVALTGRPVLAAGLLVVVTAAATGAALGRGATELGLSRWPPVVTVALLAADPLLVATGGTEVQLAVALLAALGLTVTARRPVLAGLLGGLLLLTRVDLLAFALAAVVAMLLTRRIRAAVATAVLTVAVGLPWYVAAGVPETVVAAAGADGSFWFADPLMTTLALVPAATGLLVLLARLAGRAGPVDAVHVTWGVGAVLHACTYPLLHATWYVAPAVAALTMLGGLAVPRSSPRIVVLGAFAALVAVLGAHLATRSWTRTTITGDLATVDQYRELALRAPPGAVVASFGQAGTLAYFCRCTVVDPVFDGRNRPAPPPPTLRFAIEQGEPVIRPAE